MTAAAGAGAASASAASLTNLVVSPTPEQSIPVSVQLTGYADVAGNEMSLQAVARPAGSIPCQPTMSDDTVAAGANAQTMFNGSPNTTLAAEEPFEEIAPFTPTQPGDWLVCSWISQSEPGGVTIVYGPISTTVSVRMPQVTRLTSSLPGHPVAGKAFPVRWSTKTDQTLTLYGALVYGKSAKSCRVNYSVELGHDPQAVNVEPGASVYGGPKPTNTQATVPTPGHYMLCSWLEGPLTNEVVAHTAKPVTVYAARVHR